MCVGDRVVQVDRRSKAIRNEDGVREKFGVLARADPGLPRAGRRHGRWISGHRRHRRRKGAARLLNQHGPIEAFPPAVLGDNQQDALLFKRLATLRTDAELFEHVDELRWRGPTDEFAAWAKRIDAPRLLERALKAQQRAA